jgi:hypothetical protein
MRFAALVLAVAGLAGACGSGGGDTQAPPAAKVDPNANGYVGGPINQAKTQASNLTQQQQQVEQQTGG